MRVDPLTGVRTTVSENANPTGTPNFVIPIDLALEANGNIVVADIIAFTDSQGGIIRVDPVTGVRTTVSENGDPVGGPSFAQGISGIAIEADGDILVLDGLAFGGTGGIIRVDPVTGVRTTVSENTAPADPDVDFSEPFDLALEADGDIVVSDRDFAGGSGGVIRVDPVTGDRSVVSENAAPTSGPEAEFDNNIGIAVEANGTILVSDTNNIGVIRVNPTTGARTLLSSNTSPAGEPDFFFPIGMAPDAAGNILVADATAFQPLGTGGVISVNPTSGARTLVSANHDPTGGPDFEDPSQLVIEPVPPAGPDLIPPETAITDGPSGNTLDHTPTFSFASSEPLGGFGCAVAATPLTCSSPFTTAVLPPGQYRFSVAASDVAGNTDPTPAERDFRVLAVLSDLPKPTLGRTANVEPVKGQVFISVAAGTARAATKGRAAITVPGLKGREFIPLEEARQMPIGSFLDTRKGTARVVSARGGGRTQSGLFGAGVFQVLQSRKTSTRGLTTLTLKGSNFARACGGAGKLTVGGAIAEGAEAIAVNAAKRRLSPKVVRRLRSDATGSFRTRGRHSSATVRGTVWFTEDRCNGTLTSVKRGTVAVRDFRRKRTIVLGSGKRPRERYLAEAQR